MNLGRLVHVSMVQDDCFSFPSNFRSFQFPFLKSGSLKRPVRRGRVRRNGIRLFESNREPRRTKYLSERKGSTVSASNFISLFMTCPYGRPRFSCFELQRPLLEDSMLCSEHCLSPLHAHPERIRRHLFCANSYLFLVTRAVQ